jgi:TonB family protein
MRIDFIFSFILHVAFIIIMVISAPFKPKVNTDLGDVIEVHLASLPMPAQVEIKPMEPVAIPQAVTMEEDFAVVPSPKTIDKPKKVKEKKKPPKKDEYVPPTQEGDKEQAGVEKKGEKDVTENLGSGSAFSGASIDNASFNYPYWFVQAFSKIEQNWRNPVFANRPLKCVVYFQVIRSGRILKIEVEQSSGIDAFDRACVQAIERCKTLPPLPDSFIDEILGIHLEFPYSPG